MKTVFMLKQPPVQIVAVALIACAFCPVVWSQEQSQLAEPVYRVANEATTPAAVGTPAVPAAATATPLDFTARDGEHPLAPFLRVCKESIQHIDATIQDYSCMLVKQERVDGDLGEQQKISMKVRHEPFSVYMRFLQPFQGREVLYVDGLNNNEMFVMEGGFKRKVLGKMSFAPDNALVMRGQKYPITDVGMRNLLVKLVERSEADSKFLECDVTSKEGLEIGGRMTTMVQIVHPIPRQNFRSHIVRVFFDNELRVPLHYDAFLWPDQPGQKPPLEESYTYANLKINNGYTARDFDSENPEIFRP